jgi:hypothetical protein
VDHATVFNAEKIYGGPRLRPCAVASDTRPATADSAQLAAALAAASRMFNSGTAAEQTMAEDWMMVAKLALEFAGTHEGGENSWLPEDVRICCSTCVSHQSFHALCDCNVWRL